MLGPGRCSSVVSISKEGEVEGVVDVGVQYGSVRVREERVFS